MVRKYDIIRRQRFEYRTRISTPTYRDLRCLIFIYNHAVRISKELVSPKRWANVVSTKAPFLSKIGIFAMRLETVQPADLSLSTWTHFQLVMPT